MKPPEKKIALISCCCGTLDKNIQYQHKEQSIPVDFYYFDDSNFPPRKDALHPRLQGKIPRMFGWDMVPGYDYYIWADALTILVKETAAEWLLSEIKGYDIAFFRHHDRRTSIKEELNFMLRNMKKSKYSKYLNDRYQHEPMEAQVHKYLSDPGFVDDKLYFTGSFIYKNNRKVREMLSAWFTGNARWSIQDQLSLPYVLFKSECKVKQIDRNALKNEYLERRVHETG
jgi:hypothetical protein